MKVFVSYRSLDANLARAVVDRLRASGVGVWFAEYDVLSRNYDEFERRLPRSLDEAVAGCTHALVFTNNAWCQSGYCRREMVRILEHISDPDRILEVRCPEHRLTPPRLTPPTLQRSGRAEFGEEDEDLWCVSRHCTDTTLAALGQAEGLEPPVRWVCPQHGAPRHRFEALRKDSVLRFDGDSGRPDPRAVGRLVDQVGYKWGLSIARLPDAVDAPRGEPLELAGWGIRLHPGPFKLSMVETVAMGGVSSDDAVCLEAEVEDASVKVFIFGSVVDSVLGWTSEAHATSIEDRELYTNYRRFAKEWFRDPLGRQPARTPAELRATYSHMRERGLHVAFVQGQSLPCFTYTCGGTSPDDFWERRFLLPLRRADEGARGEVSLVFRVDNSGLDAQRDRQFHNLCALFDILAYSVEFDEAVARPSVHLVGPAYVALAGWIVGLGFGLHAVLAGDASPWAPVALGAALGWLVVQAVALASNRHFRRLIFQEVMGGRDRVQSRAGFETWSNETTRYLFGFPIIAVVQLLVGFTSPVACGALLAAVGIVVAIALVTNLSPALFALVGAVGGLGLAAGLNVMYTRRKMSQQGEIKTHVR